MLREYQKGGVRWLKEHDWRAILADAPGVGKTPQVLVAIRENPRALCPALVVCPASVVVHWQREAARWIPGARVAAVEDIGSPLPGVGHLLVCSWDMLAARPDLLARRWQLVVADEGHYAKNEDTQRNQALAAICARTPHKVIVTGTPLVNDVDELRVLQRLVSGEELGDGLDEDGGNDGSAAGRRPPVPMLRRLIEEACPEIPAKRRVTLQTTIPPLLRAEYDRVAGEFAEWLGDYFGTMEDAGKLDGAGGSATSAVSATARALAVEPLAKLAYLRRVLGRGKVPGAACWTAGMVKGAPGRAGESVVVFAEHADVLDFYTRALTALGVQYVRLDGRASRRERQHAIDDFQAGRVPVFVGSSAAHVGITLHRARHVLFLERWFTSAAEEQAEDRVRRFGQTRATTMWYLEAENTIDERIRYIVEGKRALVTSVIRGSAIEALDAPGVMDTWERVAKLAACVPTVADQPSAKIELPKLPAPQYVHAVQFDPGVWPMAETIRALRQAGYPASSVVTRAGSTPGSALVVATTRAAASFRPRSLRSVKVGVGMSLVGGQPATLLAERARNRRALAPRLHHPKPKR